MYTDPVMWTRLRKRVLIAGDSIRSVSQSEHIARNTLKRILASETPPHYSRPLLQRWRALGDYAKDLHRLVVANATEARGKQRSIGEMHLFLREQGFKGSYSVVSYHAHRILREQLTAGPQSIWTKAEQLSDRGAAKFMRSLVHGHHQVVVDERKLYSFMAQLGASAPEQNVSPTTAQIWGQWLAGIENARGRPALHSTSPGCHELLGALCAPSRIQRRRALCVLAHIDGFSCNLVSTLTGASRNSIHKYIHDYDSGGYTALMGRKPRARLVDDTKLKEAIFALLHQPPSLFDINRATWKLADVRKVLAGLGHVVGPAVIHDVIKASGFRWKAAKVVLTSQDPTYREKLARIQDILGKLTANERFFSIDEFGPFAVKMKAGRAWTPPDVEPFVPQWEKSKGCLILTAALELSTNQVSHFYSEAKNTTEMIRMAEVLLEQYATTSTLYLSWDAASWHLSKRLQKFVDEHNLEAAGRRKPRLELAPLPASAQFLNVIESIFSGMARSIVHRSNYESKAAAQSAIDRYFEERNQYFLAHPQRAGKKIWGQERVAATFSVSHNCKDPAYR